MRTSTDRPTTCRTSISRRVLFVAVILALSAIAAVAAPSLSLTVAGSGTFTENPALACSTFSPQFANQTSWIGPAGCIDTITIWVFNSPPASGPGDPTDGSLVTVTNTFPVGSSKAATVIAANNFCTFGPGNCGNVPGNPSGITPGWDCKPTPQGSVTCTRSDVLKAGNSYSPIFIKVLVEDAFDNHLTEYDNLTTVSGGGSVTSNCPPIPNSFSPTTCKFTDFSGAVSVLDRTGVIEVTFHTVPEGLFLVVDGVKVTGGDRPEFWQIGSFHTIQTDDPPGTPLNAGYQVVATNTGGLVTNLFVPNPPPFILFVGTPEYEVDPRPRVPPTHDQFTAIFKQ